LTDAASDASILSVCERREFRAGGMALVDPPYEFIADGLKHGEVVAFFGAAASAVYRPLNETWRPGKPFMPFGGELARTLAKAANYPASDKTYEKALFDLSQAVKGLTWRCDDDRQLILSELSHIVDQKVDGVGIEQSQSVLAPLLSHLSAPLDLAFVASWAEHVQGHRRAVDRKLHESFAVECSPGLLHERLAGIEATQLYVTTNYDDLLEKALAPRRPHVIIDRGDKGLQVAVGGTTPLPVSPTGDELYELLNDPKTQQPSHPVLFKMHGSVDKANARNDCYLITEEDYVDFLGRADGRYVPPYVSALMQGKDFLFLGYSLEDWNVRVILRKLLTRSAAGSVKFWAIVSGHSEVEQQVWQAQNLNIYPMDLLAFSEELARHL
jgi:hypothetical protein